jgi:hypothetical protein
MEGRVMWRVKDWAKHFEKAQSKVPKVLSWVPVPNKHDGDGYTELIEHEHGALHYGAWMLLVQVASKCTPRGVLARDGGKPHDCESLGRQVRIAPRIFKEAIPRFLKIGWLEEVDDSALSTHYERAISTGQDRTGQEKTGQDRTPASAGGSASEAPTTEPAVLVFPAVGKGPSEWSLTQAFIDELKGLYPNVNVLAESKKALLKIRDKAVTAKTARGMPRFLYSWMERSQNASRAGGGDGSRQRTLSRGPGQVSPEQVFPETGGFDQ